VVKDPTVGPTTGLRPLWRRWALLFAAVLGVGPWGALAGASLFWAVGEALGVTFSDPGLLNFRFWPFLWLLLGLVLGFAAGAYAALRLVEHSPNVVGAIVVALATLTVVTTVADRNGWDWLYLWVPGLLLAAVVVRPRLRLGRQ
jgi:hypothetical protein